MKLLQAPFCLKTARPREQGNDIAKQQVNSMAQAGQSSQPTHPGWSRCVEAASPTSGCGDEVQVEPWRRAS